jgi:tRNA nucleotidyltransferase (CCA-adding enzyme)
MDVVTTHVNADFDCLGAMVAAKLLYPEALLVFAGAQDPAVRQFLQTAVGKTLTFTRCKNIDFDQVRRLILVDVNTPERIGPFGALFNRPQVEVHIYDHHPPVVTTRQPTLAVIEPLGSTVTVMVAELKKRGLFPDGAQATMMMLGLYEDTGNLLIPTLNTADYFAAAYLLQHGADMLQVSDALTRELSATQVELLHQLLHSLQLLLINGVEVYVAQASSNNYVADIAVLAHKIRDIENIDVLIIVVRLEDRLFLVARSRVTEVDVGQVMNSFGGGGHPTAASATVHDKTLIEVMQLLPQALEQHIVPQMQAQHLMSAPVHSINVAESIALARTKLTRYHVNALVVVDALAKVVGIIAHQTIERATHHGLEHQAVGEYMTAEFGVATPDSPMAVIQQLVGEQRQRLVPIVDSERLVGVVTRTDLLRYSVSEGRRLSRGKKVVGNGDGLSLSQRRVERLIDIRLPVKVRQLLKDISLVAKAQRVAVYAVGGFVRDLLLGEQNLDIDIVVEGNAIDFAHSFADKFNCRVRSHEKFITAVIIFADGFKIDVASTRTEHYLEPGALPLVEEASLKLDLYRRDFTINTLALSLNDDSFAQLLDFFGAQRDLHDKTLRVLHNLSFVEDPTRAFRIVRFEQRLGFTLGLHTERLLLSAVKMGFLTKVNPARLFNELMIILKQDAPFAAIQRLDDLGLLRFLWADFTITGATKQCFRQTGKAINWYELLFREVQINPAAVYFLCLSVKIPGAQLLDLCQRLILPQQLYSLFVTEQQNYAGAYHNLERRHNAIQTVDNHTIYRLFYGASMETLLFFIAKTKHETVRLALANYVSVLQDVTPLLNGDDLLRLGVPRGPVVGKILHQLLDAKLDDKVITREDEELLVARLVAGNS